MHATLLCVGDIHLGRRPSRIPPTLSGLGVDPGELTPEAAWERTVEAAVQHEVDAVVLLGDVVEDRNRYFEARGPLERGVRALVGRHGIEVLAVAGNHDVDVLPRLAEDIDGFTLLGRGGSWQEHPLERRGRLLLRLVGWSFPRPHVEHSPLDGLDLRAREDVPTIGLLHADLEDSNSRYAPVTREELRRAGFQAWLLGHVHKPSDLSGTAPIGYLGSLQGLSPKETGAHGPWILRAGPGRGVELEQLPLAPLRWERADLDVATLDRVEDLEPAVVAAIEDLHRRLTQASLEARAVGCRLRLVGASPIHRELARRLGEIDAGGLDLVRDGVAYFIESLVDRSRAAHDLEDLARETTPPGLLARRLLVLRGGGEAGERVEVLDAARERLAREARNPSWSLLGETDLSDAAVAELLVTAGERALDELLAQLAEGGA